MAGATNQIAGSNLWVLAYDKETNERVGIVCCLERQVAFHKAKFELDGYRAEVLTGEEIGEIIDSEKG